MPNKLVWVPTPDKKNWLSNRTGDVLDVAFTVSRLNSPGECTVTVRCVWTGQQRAKRIIGMFGFDNPVEAKAFIQDMVNQACAMFTDTNASRAWFLEQMLNRSKDTYMNPYGNPMPAYTHFNFHKIKNYTAEPVEEFDVAAHVESLPFEIDLGNEDTIVIHQDEHEGFDVSSESMSKLSSIIKGIEEASTPVVPTININGVEVPMAWPE